MNDPPVAVNDSLASRPEDAGLLVIPFAQLLLNDSPGEGETNQTLTIIAVTNAVGRSVVISGANVEFTPSSHYQGPASFTYVVQDNGTTAGVADPKTSSATVSFEMTPVNDPPLAGNDVLSSVAEDSGPRNIPLSQLLSNDLPGPIDAINEQNQSLTIIAVGGAVGGTVSLVGPNAVFTPAPDYNGPASFIYSVRDNGTTAGQPDPRTASATVSFTITEVNDPPIPQVTPLTNILEGSVLVVPISVFLTNDVPGPPNESDQTLSLIAVGGAIGGSVRIEGTNVIVELDPHFNGPGQFIYTVQDNGTTDGRPDFKTATATVKADVIPVNDPPVAKSASFGVDEDAAVSIALEGDDGDPEVNQVLTFALTVAPQHGTISAFNPATGTLVYTPAPNYAGADSFQFSVTDDATAGNPPNLTSAPGTINITVNPMPDVPTVTPATTQEGRQSVSGLIISRNPVDGSEVTHFKISLTRNGTLYQHDGTTVIANGAFITAAQGLAGLKFSPTAGLYSPGTTFGFEVQAALDALGNGLSQSASAVITVNPNLDFGDAPSPYPVLLSDNGARHVVLSTGASLFLGLNRPDVEADGQPSALATGDDNTGSQDEDGILLPAKIVAGQKYSVGIVASGFGLVNGWIDWNRDGDWNDAGEQVFVNQAVGVGTNFFELSAPGFVSAGTSFARFRLSTQSGLGPEGLASDGEVEDYAVTLVINSPPIVGANLYTVAQGTTLNANDQDGRATPDNANDDGVLAGVIDPNGDVLSVTLLGRPSFASAFTFSNNGAFVYTHDGSAHFLDTFIYKVEDGNGGIVTNTAVITITEVNKPPVAVDDIGGNAFEDLNPVLIPFDLVLANDFPGFGEDNQTLTIISVSDPVGGTVSLGASNVIFVLAPNFNGVASFTYTVQDNGTTDRFNDFKTASATVRFLVMEVNDPPVVMPISLAAIAESSGPRTIPISSLLSNVSPGPPDESSQTLTFALRNAVGGTATVSGANVVFTPAADYNGLAGFSFAVTDNGTTAGILDPRTADGDVSFTITEVNNPPLAENDILSDIAEDSGPYPIAISTLLANDSPGPANESGQSLTLTVGNAIGGSAVVSGTNIIFTPTQDYNGEAGFIYTVRDNGTTAGVPDQRSADAFVSFTITEVNDPPIAVDDTLVNIAENSEPQTIPFTLLLANDRPGPANESAQTLTIVAVENAIGGTVSLASNVVLFTPFRDYNGSARFDYTIQDNGTTDGANHFETASATARFTVTEVNNSPIAVNDVLSRIAEDSGPRTIPFAALLANDSPGPANEAGQILTLISVTNAVGGTVSIVGTNIIFTLETNYSGIATFIYTIQDNGTTAGMNAFRTAQAGVEFEVFEVNDPPAAANDTLSSVAENSGQKAIRFRDLLANDATGPTNELGQSLTIIAVTNALGGTVEISGLEILFTPAVNFNGTASFDYIVQDDGTTDGTNDFRTASATVNFRVTEVNNPPVAADDFLSAVAEDSGARTIPFSVLLANDLPGPAEEATTQVLTIIEVGGAVGGTVAISDTGVLFTPATNFNGMASFIYTVEDNGTTAGVSDPKTAGALATFEIIPVNDRPIAFNQNLAAEADGSVAITLTGDDGDPEVTQSLSFAITSPPSHGTVAGFSGGTGQFTYTPAPNYAGPDTIQFTVTDDDTAGEPALTSLPGTVTIEVGSAADIPSVTAATTRDGEITASGLVITPNIGDPNVTHFKIRTIHNGSLFLNDATTPIGNGTTITKAQGAMGLRFRPTASLYSPGSSFGFTVQAALNASGSGLSPEARAPVTVEPNLDFGDAPSPYPTSLESDGARHVVPSTGALLYLGSTPPDTETNGPVMGGGLGDDTTGTADEDGVVFSDQIRAGQPYTVTVAVTGSGILNAWIDWDRDGNWNGVGEQILTNIVTANETNVFTLIAPDGLSAGESFARFRISTQTDLAPTGMAPDGEVEDYPVTLSVKIAPLATPAVYLVLQGGTINANDANGTATPNNPNDNGVLTHVINPDGSTLSVKLVTGPSFASNFILREDGTFTYTHNGSQNFGDGFRYEVSDGQGGTNAANVILIVSAVNAPPVALDDVVPNALEDANLVRIPFALLLANDSAGPGEIDQDLSVISVTNSVGGTVSLGTNEVIFVLTPDFNGVASFEYTIRDNGTTAGDEDFKTGSATVHFLVAEVNDPPVVPANLPLSPVAEDSGQRIISISSLLGPASPGPPNESGQTLTLLSIQNVAGGTAVISGTNVIFKLAPDYNGQAGFSYTVQDNGSTAGVSDPRTANGLVNFTVTRVNDPPVAADDILNSIEVNSGVRTIPFLALLRNDRAGPANEEDQTLSVISVSNPVGGSVSIAGDTVLFAPLTNYVGNAGFAYTIQDNGTTLDVPDFKTATATVRFTIVPRTGSVPIARSDLLIHFIGESGKISEQEMLANDSNPGGEVLTITSVTEQLPSGAHVRRDNGWVIYEPPPTYNLPDSFEYIVSNSLGASAIGTVTVDLWQDDNQPTKNAISITIINEIAIVRYAGIPGRTYEIQTTSSLIPPIIWTPHPAGPQVAKPNGTFEIIDQAPPSPRFYRAIQL